MIILVLQQGLQQGIGDVGFREVYHPKEYDLQQSLGRSFNGRASCVVSDPLSCSPSTTAETVAGSMLPWFL